MSSNQESALYYYDPNPSGSKAVVLLHGLGADGESWGYQAAALSLEGFRPIAPDLPGFGRSLLPVDVKWNIAWSVQMVTRLLDQLCLDHFILVGHSMGGAVAQQLALDVGERVEKLVLINTFSRLRPRHWSELAYLMGRFAAANMHGVQSQARTVAWRIFPGSDQSDLREAVVKKITAADPRAYRSAMRALGFFDVRRKLKDLLIPTLIISGEKDNTIPLDNQADLLKNIAGSRQVIIASGGHAMTIDHAEEVNRVLLDFLAG